MFGYFALPVLVGDNIVAALDLKTDRKSRKLLVQKWSWVGAGAAKGARKELKRASSRNCTASSGFSWRSEGCPARSLRGRTWRDDRASPPTRSRRHRRAYSTPKKRGRAAARPAGQPEGVEPGEMNQPEQFDANGDPAAISAMRGRERREAAIATRKNTIVPHSIEPPYLTTKAGRPRPNPHPRKPRPQAMMARHRPARAMTGIFAPCRVDRSAVHQAAGRRPREMSARSRCHDRIQRDGWRRHGRRAWRERWPGPSRCRRCRALW